MNQQLAQLWHWFVGVRFFEHGFGVTAGSYQRMVLELVSHGYVVIAPGHPNIATTVIFEDGTKAFLKAGRDALMFETAFQDTQFVLSKIDAIASREPSMDLAKRDDWAFFGWGYNR
jgi:hypothetical protein